MANEPPVHGLGTSKSGQKVESGPPAASNGLVAKVMTRGATLVQLYVQGKGGESDDLRLGWVNVAGCKFADNQYFVPFVPPTD